MSSERRYYFYSGLQICSEWAIDQWSEFEQPNSEPPELTIRTGEPDFQIGDEDYIHQVPSIARFVLRRGREIIVIRDGDVDLGLVNQILTTSTWGAICYQRGLHLLHGSAIRVNGQAFAFSGCTGSGKSTMAAWLTLRGYETICDDTCRLEAASGRIYLYPSSRRLKLWSESLQALGWDSPSHEQETPEFDKVHVVMPGSAILDQQPLGAVYLIGWGDLGMQRLTGAEAVSALLESATYRPEFLEPLRRTQSFIQSAIQIASRVPIYKLSRPCDFAAFDDTIELLERHWSDEYSQR